MERASPREKFSRRLYLATLALTTAASPHVAMAQTSDMDNSATSPSAAEVNDSDTAPIVVTAQRREQDISDVPISVSVISGAQAREAGVSSTGDLARLVPGLAIGQNSGEGDFPFISLRGVSMRDFADTNESPAAVYINDFYKANLQGLDSQIYDLERIEVLRGPQGTLYGRNATGGLINYITAAPTDEFEGYASFLVGERDRYKLEAALSAPISDSVRSRFSFFHHEHDGYIKNNFPGSDDGNALDATSARGQLSIDLSPSLTADLFAQYYYNDNDAGNAFTHIAVTQDPVTGLSVRNPGGTDAFGFGDSDPGETNSNFDAFLKNDQFTGIVKLNWDINDSISLMSISGYEAGEKHAAFDSDGTPGGRSTEVRPKAKQFSQELRLSGESDRLFWTTGLYYFDYHVDGFQRRTTSVAAGPRPPVFYDLKTDSWAVFGNVDFELTPSLTLTGGLRYTEENKEYSLNNTDTGPVFNVDTAGDLAKRDDDNLSFNARMSWEPTETVLLYGGVSRAFKAGTFNVGYTPIAVDAITVKPEQLTAYEVGAKYFSPDNRFSASGAVFYYDYKDSQAYQFDGQLLASTTFNRDSEIWGAEFEFAAEPITGLNLRGSVTYLDATLLDIELPGPGFGNGPTVDTDVPLAPDWSGNLSASYSFAGPFDGTMKVAGDVSYTGDQFFDAFNSPSQFEDDYIIGNVRVSWTDPEDKFTLAAFADNVTDTVYRTAAFDLAFLGFATEVYGRPRWIGGSVTYRFGE